jgi:hypothetical protein
MRAAILVSAGIALLLAPAVQAGQFQPGAKRQYFDHCVAFTHLPSMSTGRLARYCRCAADAIERHFSDADINQLSSDLDAPTDTPLQTRAETTVTKACHRR